MDKKYRIWLKKKPIPPPDTWVTLLGVLFRVVSSQYLVFFSLSPPPSPLVSPPVGFFANILPIFWLFGVNILRGDTQPQRFSFIRGGGHSTPSIGGGALNPRCFFFDSWFIGGGGTQPQIRFIGGGHSTPVFNHKGSTFQGVAPHYFVFFHILGGAAPLVSR